MLPVKIPVDGWAWALRESADVLIHEHWPGFAIGDFGPRPCPFLETRGEKQPLGPDEWLSAVRSCALHNLLLTDLKPILTYCELWIAFHKMES